MNEQELFWKGEFGDDYITRNTLENVPIAVGRWAKFLTKLPFRPQSILELGCNIGINLQALCTLFPQAQIDAVEINERAAKLAQEKTVGKVRIFNESLLDFKAQQKYDLTFTSGVLIHINPKSLPQAYDQLYSASSRFILINEYYNPTPVEVNYRGHEGKLFKRDFCGELLERFSDLRLIDYGFIYHKDSMFRTDDSTWFLLEKVK